MMKSEIAKPDTFLYFSYGANIFAFRMHMHCESAEFVSIARADNLRLHFGKYSKYWGGPTATLVPTANAHVWGVIWRINNDDMSTLDNTKGVEIKKYFVKYIPVLTPYMGIFRCRAYIQKVNPLPRGDNEEIPVDRWPSWMYKEVMIVGALEHGIPRYYIKQIKKLKDNDEDGCFKMDFRLTRYAKNAICECRVPGRIPRKPLKLDVKSLKDVLEARRKKGKQVAK